MKNSRCPVCLAVLALGLCSPRLSPAQEEGVTSRRALEFLEMRFGAQRFQGIVALRGTDGVSQPEEWEAVVFDENSPYNLRYYWVNRKGETSDEGPADEFYPTKPPDGFVHPKDLKVDSMAAFTIAESEARKARVGFDHLNYLLKAREFSREPIWKLELIDANKRLAGTIFLSGETGEVLRTIWISRIKGQKGNSLIISDSYAPNAAPPELTDVPSGSPPGGLPLVPPPVIDPQAPLLPPTGTMQAPVGSVPKSDPRIPPPVIPDDTTRIPPPPVPSGESSTRIPPPPIPVP